MVAKQLQAPLLSRTWYRRSFSYHRHRRGDDRENVSSLQQTPRSSRCPGSRAESLRSWTRSRANSEHSVAQAESMSRHSPLPELDDSKDSGVQAVLLARDLHLDLHEVKLLLQELRQQLSKQPWTGMDLLAFEGCLLQTLGKLGIEEVSEELVQDAYRRCQAADGPVCPRQFMSWYRDHFFAIGRKPCEEQTPKDLILELAKKHRCSCNQLDKIKLKFDSFDLDKSGLIEYKEFEAMMCKLLNCPNKSDLPMKRMPRFWQELDADASGSVDFSEFIVWYMKYFARAEDSGPVEAFYASFLPGVKHLRSLRVKSAESLEEASPGAEGEQESDEESEDLLHLPCVCPIAGRRKTV